jgi:hypothetical protein
VLGIAQIAVAAAGARLRSNEIANEQVPVSRI